MLTKTRTVHLVGRKLSDLNERIWERDNQSCVICGVYVPNGTKFHHIVFRSQGGGDVEDNGATLCQMGNNCHGNKAHGPEAKEIRAFLLDYVRNINAGA